jgi:hypothetical protein
MMLDVRANRGAAGAARLPLLARVDELVGVTGKRTFRARLTRAGRRLLAKPGMLSLTARLYLRASEDTRRWRESRALRLR